MRKVIYSMSVSLDGYVETLDNKIDWVIVDEEFHLFANQQARESSVFLYGRRLYELMASFWPTAETDSSAPSFVIEFARIWKDKPKIVFSRTLEKVEWNSRLIRENIAEEIMKLKSQPGGDMGLGGAEIASVFMQFGLIDEYHVFINPVVLGGGTPFFPALSKAINLRLVDKRTFRSGVVYLSYQLAESPSSRGETTPLTNQTGNQESDLPNGLGRPAQRALAGAGFSLLAQLSEVSESELLQLHGIGPNALAQLRSALAAKRLSFAKRK